MKYPTIPNGDLAKAVSQLRAGQASIDGLVKLVGRGAEPDLPDVAAVSEEMKSALNDFLNGPHPNDQDSFEGAQSRLVYELLGGMETHILDDPGFWAWVSLCHFWWLVTWREGHAFEKEPAKWLLYIDGTRPAECVLLRMFLRGQIAAHAGDPALASCLPRATDFWRSHITRVSTGRKPEIAAALIRSQANDKLTTDPLRRFARRLNRMSTNVVLETYDKADADALIAELRE
jgi:hypothetical protein